MVHMHEICELCSYVTRRSFALIFLEHNLRKKNSADLTYRLKEASEMLTTILETQPKDSGGGT